MKETIVNLEMINHCLLAVSKKEFTRNCCRGVLIRDKGDTRQYVATNGYILIVYEEEQYANILENELILKPLSKIRKFSKNCDPLDQYARLQIIDRETALLRSNQQKIVCDILDCTFPDFEKSFLSKETPEANFPIKVDSKYLKILEKVMGSSIGKPKAIDEKSPVLWESDSCKVIIAQLKN